MNDIAIIGTGRLGTSLASALVASGYRVRWLSDRYPAAVRASRKIVGRGATTTEPAVAASGSDILFLCLPEGAVVPAERRLAGADADWATKTVFHTSGLRPSRDLASLRAAGAAVASFHPIQSFPRKDMPPSHFFGIFVGLEGDAKAVRLGKTIARRLGARPLLVDAENKAFYHAACSMASNLLVPLFDAARRLLRRAGMNGRDADRVLVPLVEGTLRNVKKLDAGKALTGPIARGDAATVKAHLAALEPFPAARRIYKTLGAEALRIAKKRNLSPAQVKALGRLLAGK